MELNMDAFKYAINKIDDGFVFENFGLSFLGGVFGYEFIPVGGVKDKGIDGLQYLFSRKGYDKNLYQLSTEHNAEGKIQNSLDKLVQNQIPFDSFCYVTNRTVLNKDVLIDRFFDQFKKQIRIYDQIWFALYANHSQATINTFNTFVTSYLHEFQQPGKSYVVSNLETDSRLFVFLRQQLDSTHDNAKLDELLSDTLILFALEGTDPDKNIFKTSEELKQEIKRYVKFDAKILDDTIDNRLHLLSSKPNRKIKYHTRAKAYCLPYETRIEIQNRNLADQDLLDKFQVQTE
jgi:hypothetical protein